MLYTWNADVVNDSLYNWSVALSDKMMRFIESTPPENRQIKDVDEWRIAVIVNRLQHIVNIPIQYWYLFDALPERAGPVWAHTAVRITPVVVNDDDIRSKYIRHRMPLTKIAMNLSFLMIDVLAEIEAVLCAEGMPYDEVITGHKDSLLGALNDAVQLYPE